MNIQPNNYNIEDTGALMTRAKGGGRNKRIIIAAVAAVAVLAIALVGLNLIGDKRYNDQIEIAEKEFAEGNYEQAEAAYLKAVEMKKRKPKAREGLAYTYAVQGKTDEAIEIYDDLFADTKESKYENASRGLAKNGSLPIDADLAPAIGKWRPLDVNQIPYKDDCDNYIYALVFDFFYNGHSTYDEAMSKPPLDKQNSENFVLVSRLIDGYGLYGTSIELRESNEEYWNLKNDVVKTVEDEKDPRGWYNNGNPDEFFFDYKVANAEEIDKMAEIVFNLSEDDIAKVVAAEEIKKINYKQDDKYYSQIVDTGAKDFDVEMVSAWTDGEKYCIKYDEKCDYTAGSFEPFSYTYYALLEPKEIEGEHYWSVHYNGMDMPEEIEGLKSVEPEDEPNPEPKEEPKQNPLSTLVEPTNTAESGMHGFVSADGDGLNLRYGPGTEYDSIKLLKDGTDGIERGWNDAGDWIFIETGGVLGWVKSEYFVMGGGKEKPVIYLYPTRTTDVSVKVSLTDGYFTKTIPAANNGVWNVTANPNGIITDKASGKTYDYLFWESSDNTEYDWSKGYVVSGYEAEGFLKKTLPELGLNRKESEEFTEYWLPRLQKNKYNLVTFQTKCYTDVAKLNVNPKPDSTLRVFMAFKEISKPIPIEKPTIVPFERKGFTVVEWGGAEVK